MTAQQHNSLTNKNMMELFGVSHVTIFNWRNGSPQRKALPTVKVGATIRYPVGKIRVWAKQHGIVMLTDPSKLVGTGIKKPGPKKRIAVKTVTATDGVKKARLRDLGVVSKKRA